MIFSGDLSKYHPADAIMFLSQLNLNGVFSIVENQHLIALSFNNGFIIDAHSKRGDAKILQVLIYQRRVSRDQVQRIRRVQAETGMPVRSILAQLNFFPLSDASDILLVGMREVLLEMFLLESGSFHFTDTPVDPDDAGTRLDARTLAIRIAAQSDEYRDFEKSVGSLDRQLSPPVASPTHPLPAEAQTVLRLASNCRSIRRLLEKAPIDSYTAMEIVKAQLDAGTIALLPAPGEVASAAAGACGDPLFTAFRQAMKKLMLINEPFKQLELLVAYCRDFYDGILILTAKNGQLVHCKKMILGEDRGFVQTSEKGRLGGLSQDPILLAVHRSGVGFFGEHFPSKLLDGLSGAPTGGECALIPAANQGDISFFLYVFTRNKFSGLSPQHYLELLSWMAAVRKGGVSATAVPPGDRHAGKQETARQTEAEAPTAASLIAKIDDLPPLPTLVTRALELLSDPGTAVKEIESVIGKDQSLVSKLIRVSNSALYGGLNRVESLQQALTRLGAKTTKSLIVASSMQSYFLKTDPGLQSRGTSLWQHAAECGLAARRIAVCVGYDQPETAFVGGVVHDIGKLVILLAGNDASQQIQNLKRRETIADVDAERRIMGTDHVAIGVRLMEKWKMPASARGCVQYHHRVEEAGESRRLAAITAYADHLSHLYGAHPRSVTPEDQAAIDSLVRYLMISTDQQNVLVESVSADFQEAALF